MKIGIKEDININLPGYQKYWNETYGLTSFEKEDLQQLSQKLYDFLNHQYRKSIGIFETRLEKPTIQEAKTKILPRRGTIKVGPVLVKFERHLDDKGEFDQTGEHKNKVSLTYEIDGYGPAPEREMFKSDKVYWDEFDKFIKLLNPYIDEITNYFRSRGYSLWTY